MVLGTRTFEDVLFTDETETPVNVLLGEIPALSQASVDEAQAFAAGIESDTPHIALPDSVETQVETASKPYTAAAYFHFEATGSLKCEKLACPVRYSQRPSRWTKLVVLSFFVASVKSFAEVIEKKECDNSKDWHIQ